MPFSAFAMLEEIQEVGGYDVGKHFVKANCIACVHQGGVPWHIEPC